jgi:histidine triad (HIT) family protein
MPTDCLFCKIASGVITVERIHEDADCLCFPDINPQAPTHLLLIPKQHFASLAHTTADDTVLLGKLLLAADHIARTRSLGKGYRIVLNNGSDGGQTVEHLHLHLLGGRPMHWPPG